MRIDYCRACNIFSNYNSICSSSNNVFLTKTVSSNNINSNRLRARSVSMTLVPLHYKQMARVAPRQVNPDQWRSYWGINKIERLQRVLESVLIAYGGAWLSWFFSFMAGSFVSTLVGTGLIFNWMLNPWLTSNRNNNSLWEYKGRALRHAYFKGRVQSLTRVRRRSGKTVGALTQEYLDMIIRDEFGRELEMVTPWQDYYRRLRTGMTIETIIASTRADFSAIVTLTDAYVPSCDVWLGDYPYVDKAEFKKLASFTNKKLMTVPEASNDTAVKSRESVVQGGLDLPVIERYRMEPLSSRRRVQPIDTTNEDLEFDGDGHGDEQSPL